MALRGDTLNTERRAGEGRPSLMPCLHKAQASHNAVAQSPYLVPVPRSDSAKIRARASREHLPSLRTWAGKPTKRCSPAFPIRHSILRAVTSLFVAESEIATEPFSGQRKSFRPSEN